MASAPVDLLQQVPLFARLGRRELDRVAHSMKGRNFEKGDVITSEGKGGVGFFVIEDGEAIVTVRGDERARLGPGDYLGEIALITESDRTATITADTDMKCWGLTMWDFRPLVESNASIAWEMLRAMAVRLTAAENRAAELEHQAE